LTRALSRLTQLAQDRLQMPAVMLMIIDNDVNAAMSLTMMNE